MIKDKTNILERLALMAWNHDGEENKTLMDAIFIISNQQEIVRCNDCKFYPNGDGTTKWTPCREIITQPGWFCADGERKDE